MMARVLRGILIGLVGLLTGGWSAEPPAPTAAAPLADLIERIEDHFGALRETCTQQLDDGVARGFWNAEERLYAEDAMRRVFDSGRQPARDEPGGRPRLMRSSTISDDIARVRLLARGAEIPSRRTAVLFDWLGARTRVLSDLRDAAGRAFVSLATEEVEQAWLAARSEEELAPALVVLRRAESVSRRLDARPWRAAVTAPTHPAFRPSAGLPMSVPNDAETALLIDYWSLLNPEKPLLLPAEDATFAEFAHFRIIASVLQGKGMSALDRPGVAMRVSALRSRFREGLAAIHQALDDAIIRDLPAQEFARELDRLTTFTAFAPPNVEDRSRRFVGLPGAAQPIPRDSIDYRDRVALEVAVMFQPREPLALPEAKWPPGTFQLLRLPEPPGDYAAWLAFRMAETSGASDDLAVAVQRLRRALPNFRAPVIAHIQRRLQQFGNDGDLVSGARESAQPGEAPGTRDPVESLIAALEKLASAESGSGAEQLVAIWRALRAPGAPNSAELRADATHAWTRLLSTPGRLPLAKLRDRAAGALLAAGSGAPAASPNELRQRLSAALKKDSFVEAARLVAIAHAAALLPPEEVSAYRAEIETLRSIPTGDAARDRAALRSLILRAGGRFTGEVAARRWKAMR